MPSDAHRFEFPPAGGVAWLDVSDQGVNGHGTLHARTTTANGHAGVNGAAASNGSTRPRTGPLGLQITPLDQGRGAYYFRGARLRGTRCIWSASTLSGVELGRPARTAAVPMVDRAVHVLARTEAPGSVFDPSIAAPHGTLRIVDSASELNEQFPSNTHLYTLNVPQAAIGLEPAVLSEMFGQTYDLTPLQGQLLRSAVSLLLVGSNEFSSATSLIGIDRYLAALAGLLVRTAVSRPTAEMAQMESVRSRTDAIIQAQAADPMLTPATIAAQLNISLRQLYRAFNGVESPAARIRRRRLDRAAEMLSGRQPQTHVERVAQECGFVSAEYFSRAFRREFGLSPRAYRAAHREPSGR